MDSFTIELFCNASGELFADKTLRSFTKFLPEQVDLGGGGGGNGRLQFEKYPTHQCSKYNGGEIQVF